MPNLFNTETISFYGMEKDELHVAYHRYRRSAGERYSVLRRIWWRNRLGLLALVVIGVPGLILNAWIVWRLYATGSFWLEAASAIVAFCPLFFLAKSQTMTELAERWKREEERARDLFEVDAATATAAVKLYRERWPGDDIDAA